MITIQYQYDTNRARMLFDFRESTPDDVSQARHGDVYNGVTPLSTYVAASPAEAAKVLDALIGNTWGTWSLLYVEPADASPYYTSGVSPTVLRKRHENGFTMRIVCSKTKKGFYTAAE